MIAGARSCLDDETLAAYLELTLPASELTRIAGHLQTCATCAQLFADCRQALTREPSRPAASLPHAHTIEASASDTALTALATRLQEGITGAAPLVGRFRLERVVGLGERSAVYAAHDPGVDGRDARKVALKLLHREAPLELEVARARMQALARLGHPNLVDVLAIELVAEQRVVIMELVDGVTLAEWLRREPRTWREVLRVFVSAGEGLAAAQRAGLVHGRFAASRVIVGRGGRVGVVGFALAPPDDTTAALADDTRAFATALGEALHATGDVLPEWLTRALQLQTPSLDPLLAALIADPDSVRREWLTSLAGDARYRIEAEFAHGGLGAVYRAHDVALGRVVAVKLLRAHTPAASHRFRREALITARLQHPAIVPVYEAGTVASGEPFYAMRLVAGQPLRQLIDDAPALDRRLALLPNLVTVAEAVAYAHSQGVIHRDLKPANIIIGDFGETVVIDWGLAKRLRERDPKPASDALVRAGDSVDSLDEDGDGTRQGAIMGTPQYMPPEQARGAAVDARADVYALGAVLYHLLVGAAPYKGASKDAVRAVLDAPPPPIETLQRGAPPDLVTIAKKAMAREPSQRYPDAGAFAADLRRFVSGQLVAAHDYSTLALMARFVGRHRVPVALSLFFVALLTAVGVTAFRRVVRERDRVTTRSNELILASARASLADDPTATLAWLKTYPRDGADWDQARGLALEALGLGVARDAYWTFRRTSFPGLSSDGRLLARQSETGPLEVTGIDDGKLRARIPVDGWTWMLHFSPDGTRVFNEGGGRKLFTWDWSAGEWHQTSAGPGYFVQALDDGAMRLGYAQPVAGKIMSSDVETGTIATELSAPGPIAGVIVDRQNHRLIAVREDGVVVIKDLASGAVRSVAGVKGLQELALSRDGRVLAGVGDSVERVDLERGLVTMLRGDGPHLGAVAFTGDGKIATGDALGHLVVYGADGHAEVHEGHTRFVSTLSSGDGGARIASGSRDNTVRVWDLRDGDNIVLRGHGGMIARVDFTEDGRHLVATAAFSGLRVWQVPRGALAVVQARQAEPTLVTPLDDAHVISSSSDDGLVRYSDFTTRQSTTLADHVNSFGIAHDHDQVAITGETDELILWRRDTGQTRRLRFPGLRLDGQLFTCDDKELLTTTMEGKLLRWSLATGTARVIVDEHVGLYDAVLSSDCRLLATRAYDHRLRVYDLVAGGAPRVFDKLDPLAFMLDGRRLVAASTDHQQVSVLELPSGRVLGVVNHGTSMRNFAHSDDGTRLATTDTNGIVRLTDVRDGRSRALRGHSGAAVAAAFSPDGKWLATGGADRKVRVWDVASGAQLAAIAAGDTVVQLSFLDGDRLLAADNIGRLRIWRVEPEGPATFDATELRKWLLATTNVVLRGDGKLASP